MTPDEEIAALKAETSALREPVQTLLAEVQELKEHLHLSQRPQG